MNNNNQHHHQSPNNMNRMNNNQQQQNPDFIRVQREQAQATQNQAAAAQRSKEVNVKDAVFNIGKATTELHNVFGDPDGKSYRDSFIYKETQGTGGVRTRNMYNITTMLGMKDWIKRYIDDAFKFRDEKGFFEIITDKEEQKKFNEALVDQIIATYCFIGTERSEMKNVPIDKFIEIDTHALAEEAKKSEIEKSREFLQERRLAREHNDIVALQRLMQSRDTLMAARKSKREQAASDDLVNSEQACRLRVAARVSEFEYVLEAARHAEKNEEQSPLMFLFNKFYDAVAAALDTYGTAKATKKDTQKLLNILSGKETRVTALESKVKKNSKAKYKALARHFKLGYSVKRLITDCKFDGKLFYEQEPFKKGEDSLANLSMSMSPQNKDDENDDDQNDADAIGEKLLANAAKGKNAKRNHLASGESQLEEPMIPSNPNLGTRSSVASSSMDESGGYIEEIVFSVPIMRTTYKLAVAEKSCCGGDPEQKSRDDFAQRSRSTFGIKNFHKFVDAVVESKIASSKVKMLDFTMARLSPRDSKALARLVDAVASNVESICLASTAIDENSFPALCKALQKCTKLRSANVSVFFTPQDFDLEKLENAKSANMKSALESLRALDDDQSAMIIKSLGNSEQSLVEIVCAGGTSSWNLKNEPTSFQQIISLLQLIVEGMIPPHGGGEEKFARAVAACVLRSPKLLGVYIGQQSLSDENVGVVTRSVFQSKRVLTCDIRDNMSIERHEEDSCCSCLFSPTVTEVIDRPSEKTLAALDQCTEYHRIMANVRLVLPVIKQMYSKFDSRFKTMTQEAAAAKKKADDEELRKSSEADRAKHERELELRRAAANHQVLAFGNNMMGANGAGGSGMTAQEMGSGAGGRIPLQIGDQEVKPSASSTSAVVEEPET